MLASGFKQLIGPLGSLAGLREKRGKGKRKGMKGKIRKGGREGSTPARRLPRTSD